MSAENRFKRQNSQKVIGEKPPPKAEFPKGGWFLKRFSLKRFKNHIFSKNNFKKQNSQKGIGAKPPPKAEFLKGGWFLKRLSLKLFKNQKQNARKEDGCWRDLAWNYSKTTFLQKTALKSRILKRPLEKNRLQKQNSQKEDGFWRDPESFPKQFKNVFWKDSEVECGFGKPSLKAKRLLKECAFLTRFSLNLLKNNCFWRAGFPKECGFGKTTSENTILEWKVVL